MASSWHNLLNFLLICVSIGSLKGIKVDGNDANILIQDFKSKVSSKKLVNPTPMSTWDISTSCEDWISISCDDFGRVTSINLSLFYVAIQIPRTLSKLEKLKYLTMSGMGLIGSIPSNLGNLPELSNLDLSMNNLTGEIPSSLTNSTSLKSLNLNDNRLSGSIPNFNPWSTLSLVDFSSNKLSGIVPPSIGNALSMNTLFLQNNYFSGGLPISLGKLNMLTQLCLDNNDLSGAIPIEFGNLTSLSIISLKNNNFSGEIPASFKSLKLTTVVLSNNSFTGDFLSILSRGLNILDLSVNNFTGKIPEAIKKSSQLQILNLSKNGFEGEIPITMGFLDQLSYIDLSMNKISGKIPWNFENLTNLISLNISRNQLNGEIPEGLKKLDKLTHMNLEKNFLNGSLPKSLRQLFLDELNVAENFLTGSLLAFGSSRENSPHLINVSHNFFTDASKIFFDSKDFAGCPSNGTISYDIKGNCISPSIASCSSSISPRNSSECLSFCGVLNPKGQCDGSGTCVIDSYNPISAHCECEKEFVEFNHSCSNESTIPIDEESHGVPLATSQNTYNSANSSSHFSEMKSLILVGVILPSITFLVITIVVMLKCRKGRHPSSGPLNDENGHQPLFHHP